MPYGIPGSRGTCTVVEDGVRCPNPHSARGMCLTHYLRWWRAARPTVKPESQGSVRLAFLVTCVAERDRSSGCWLWEHSASDPGYGQVRYRGRTRLVAHVVLELDGRPRPSPSHVSRHSCDTPACFNPAHLDWGTHQDNTDDKLRRGRQRRGEEHGMAKLTADQVRKIRARVAAGEMQKEVALAFDVSRSTVSHIVRRETWAHLD